MSTLLEVSSIASTWFVTKLGRPTSWIAERRVTQGEVPVLRDLCITRRTGVGLGCAVACGNPLHHSHTNQGRQQPVPSPPRRSRAFPSSFPRRREPSATVTRIPTKVANNPLADRPLPTFPGPLVLPTIARPRRSPARSRRSHAPSSFPRLPLVIPAPSPRHSRVGGNPAQRSLAYQPRSPTTRSHAHARRSPAHARRSPAHSCRSRAGGNPGGSFDKLGACPGPDPGTNEAHRRTSTSSRLRNGLRSRE